MRAQHTKHHPIAHLLLAGLALAALAACDATPAPFVATDAATEDTSSATDVPVATDASAPRDVPVATDASAPRDVPVATDASAPRDVPVATDASAPRDVPVATDGSIPRDVPAVTDAAGACAVRGGTTETMAGQVGGSGGSPAMDLQCPPGDEIIGVAVRMSDGATAAGDMRSAVGFSIVCAAVRVGAGGPSVGAETTVEVEGDGRFGWTPATQTGPVRCPAGWVVSGLQASRGRGGERFLDVSVTCAELRADGSPSGMTRTLYVEGSLREDPVYDTAACPAGQVVSHLGTRAGAGLDAVVLFCATPACEP